MPSYTVTLTTSEIWTTTLVVEADSLEDAEKRYNEGHYEETDREYIDTVYSEFNIEEDK